MSKKIDILTLPDWARSIADDAPVTAQELKVESAALENQGEIIETTPPLAG